jgi:hypothetical protein
MTWSKPGTWALGRVSHRARFKNFDIEIFIVVESLAYKLGLLTTMAMPCKRNTIYT